MNYLVVLDDGETWEVLKSRNVGGSEAHLAAVGDNQLAKLLAGEVDIKDLNPEYVIPLVDMITPR